MPLFKAVKKPIIKQASAGGDVSPLRPRYVEKTPACIAGCLAGVDVRDWVNTLAQAEAYGRSNEQAFEMAWRKITDRNPFPAICGRVCRIPARTTATASPRTERWPSTPSNDSWGTSQSRSV